MKTRSNHRSIYVYAHWAGLKDPVYMGVLDENIPEVKRYFHSGILTHGSIQSIHRYLILSCSFIPDFNMQEETESILVYFSILHLTDGADY